MLHNLYTAANPLHANRQPPATPTVGDGMDAETAPDDEYVPDTEASPFVGFDCVEDAPV